MANPNIVGVTSIQGESQGFNLSATTSTALMTVAATKLVKINNMLVANVHGTNAGTVDLKIVKAGYTSAATGSAFSTGTFFILKTVSVGPDSTLVVLDSPIYLQPGDVLQGGANATSTLDLIISYEVIDDA